MMMKSQKFETVQDYMASLPEDSQRIIKLLRSFLKKELPDADEVISYNMPAFKKEGIVIWYAAFKDHISIFPRTSKMKSLAAYQGGTGTVKFPKGEPLPFDVIAEFVQFRIRELQKKSKQKKVSVKRATKKS
jgi:uncharacterized protein YdhG (YjbR/CyaY superfamily)